MTIVHDIMKEFINTRLISTQPGPKPTATNDDLFAMVRVLAKSNASIADSLLSAFSPICIGVGGMGSSVADGRDGPIDLDLLPKACMAVFCVGIIASKIDAPFCVAATAGVDGKIEFTS